ncbi:MAG TPA: KUP/HAK/KT family potassium transporter, partial [Propionibacteriaceae bacterium]|nr:KUP/HAK/KT family potassium transporter [Propionibacteriaceae bacterium]
ALTLNYLGQGGLILANPSAVSNPFFLLVPGWARLPLVILATAATVIASQAVISGAFSMTRQAIQLGFLPPLSVRQTSEHEAGQIYLRVVNAGMFAAVLVLMLAFQSSQGLATAYGVSVTGALLIDTLLLLVVARSLFQWSTWQLVLAAVMFGGTEVTFLAANLTKVFHGGWLPLLIAAVMFTVMTTWQKGRTLITDRRNHEEGPLADFVERLHTDPVTRIPGTAIFPHPTKQTTPLALRANVQHNHVLHEHVVIVSAITQNVPHVAPDQQVSMDDLGYSNDGIVHLLLNFGFADNPDIPGALRQASGSDGWELEFDPDAASYFVSRATLSYTRGGGMSKWRTLLFITLARNAADPSVRFGLPAQQTVVMGTRLEI